MLRHFGVVHLPTFQGQEMEAILNAANAATAVVIENVVQLILCSLCSVTCVHKNIHIKTETTVTYFLSLVIFRESGEVDSF